MNYNVFPVTYGKELESQAQKDISIETSQNNERITALDSRRGVQPSVGQWVGGGFGISALVGFFACIGMCIAMGFNIGAGSGVVCLVLGTVLSAILGVIAKSTYKKRISKIEHKIDAFNNDSKNKISMIQSTKSQKVAEYTNAFEKEAQEKSVNFADSDLAKEVIAWMTEGFCKKIDYADRRSHIKQINVPFLFDVYRGRIVCNLGTYDFQIKRCRELRDPIEQTALARAIASTIQLQLIMKYPKDASGTDISIGIKYTYGEHNASASVTYIAPNGNYIEVKDW